MYKFISQLSIFLVSPLLLGASSLEITEENIKNNRDYYEVIGATSGEKIEKKLYAPKRVIQTHVTAISAIREALVIEGVDLATVRVLLYYDDLTVSDSAPARMWQTKAHPDTISSPWLDLTKTVTISGEIRMTVRIDATVARLINDLYSKSENKLYDDNFLSIPSIKQSCYSEIINKYEVVSRAITKSGFAFPISQEITEKNREYLQSFECVPRELRESLRYFFKGSSSYFGGIDFGVNDRLFFHCQDEAEEYYIKLYSQLIVRELQILENKSNLNPKWWTKIINRIEPIKKC